jgi:hypothetical protein
MATIKVFWTAASSCRFHLSRSDGFAVTAVTAVAVTAVAVAVAVAVTVY